MILISAKAKYLDVLSEAILTYKSHVEHVTNKVMTSIWLYSRCSWTCLMFGETWELKFERHEDYAWLYVVLWPKTILEVSRVLLIKRVATLVISTTAKHYIILSFSGSYKVNIPPRETAIGFIWKPKQEFYRWFLDVSKKPNVTGIGSWREGGEGTSSSIFQGIAIWMCAKGILNFLHDKSCEWLFPSEAVNRALQAVEFDFEVVLGCQENATSGQTP